MELLPSRTGCRPRPHPALEHLPRKPGGHLRPRPVPRSRSPLRSHRRPWAEEQLRGRAGPQVNHGGTLPTSATVWSLAFAPSGDQVAIGCDDGSVWLWDLNRKGKDGFRRLGKHPGAEGFDYVRLVQFRDEGRVLSVAEDGQVVEWDARRTNAAPTVLFYFTLPQSPPGAPKLARVVMSPDRQWLAAAVEANRTVLQSWIAGGNG
ncbi:MAG: hypothetical protein JO112_01495 [Planctomycetes bacterium]|nr:hypothetical protein [Planctomycetota bacterium]